MKKIGVILGVAAVAVLVFVSVGSARERFPTTLNEPQGVFLGNDDFRFDGDLSSPKHNCLRGRKVKMYKQTASGFSFVDRDRSNGQGEWTTEGHLPGQPVLKFKVNKKRLANGKVCKGDSIRFH